MGLEVFIEYNIVYIVATIGPSIQSNLVPL